MTNFTRRLSTIAAAAIVVTTAVAVGAGQPPAAQGPGPGQGRPGGPLRMLRQLNLTDTQQEQVRALIQEQRGQSAEHPARRLVDLQRALHAAIFADAPDNAQIDQLRAGIAEAEAAMLVARVELQLKIAQILTPEQRTQARELANRRPGRGGRAGGRRAGAFGENWHATRP